MEHLRQHWRKLASRPNVEFNSVSDDPGRWDSHSAKWPERDLTGRTKRVGEITMHLADYGDDKQIFARIGDRVVGTAYFGYVGTDLRAAVQVDPKYRRRGVATAMYVWVEEVAGDKLTPDTPHTPYAEALWSQPNRPFGRTASMKDRAYRGVPLKLDAGQGVPILQALVKGQRNVAARLIIDAMAMRAMDKQRWWSVGDHPGDEAGRWWTSSKSAAYDYASGSYSENWMTMPVVMTAEFSEANDSAREDGQGAWWWHLPAGHPLTIVKFEAAIPDDPQALLDGWNGISSPGNFDHPVGVDGDFVDLPIPPMRTTAAVDYRKLVDALPSSYDQAIASAMENAYDMGLREDGDDDGAAFWASVYGEVMA